MEKSEYGYGRQRWLQAFSRPVFGPYNIGETTGLWLATRREGADSLLARELAFGNLEFTSEAYLTYCEQIRLTQKRFTQLPFLAPVLQELNAGIFKHQDEEDCHRFVASKLAFFARKSEALLRDFTTAFNQYHRLEKSRLRQGFLEVSEQVEKLSLVYAQEVSGKRSARKQWLANCKSAWGRLRQLHESHAPFTAQWPDEAEKWTLSQWDIWKVNYLKALKSWQESHRSLLREAQVGLSVASAGEAEAAWVNLVSQQQELFEELNNSGLFQRPFPANAGTLVRIQKALEQLLEKLRHLQLLLPVLPDFYHWQRNWFDLPAELRRVVTALMHFPESDWLAAFSSWYFEGGLDQSVPLITYPPFMSQLATVPSGHTGSVQTIEAGAPFPPGDFDLVILLGADYPKDYPDLPIVQLLPPGTSPAEESSLIYISTYGQYNPGLAFCQSWTTSLWANWSLGTYPDSAAAAAVEISQFFHVAADLATPAKQGTHATLVRQDRWSIIVQAEEKSEPRLLEAPEWGAGKYQRALVFVTSVGAADEQLASLLPSLWSNCAQCRFLVDYAADELTNALFSDGYNGPFAVAATLRGIEAILDQNRAGWEAMAAEVRKRLGASEARPHPLLVELLPIYQERYPNARLQLHYGWRDLHFPLLIEHEDGSKQVVLVDDLLPGADTIAVETERRRELEVAGFQVETILSTELLENGGDFG